MNNTLTIKKYINEHFNFIKALCYAGSKTLISAPTGVGKTYTFLNIGKEILKESYGEFIYIFTTPTRVQTEQNGFNYDTFTIISGVNDLDFFKVNCVVYDKLNVILENIHRFQDKKIILIVDEAHELIYSNKYRKKALERIKELSELSYSVVHTTATSRGLQLLFNYHDVFNFVCDNKKKNKVELLINNDPIKSLVDFTLKKIKSNQKILININDKYIITQLKDIFNNFFKNKKIVTLSSETKNDEDFKFLIKNNKLHENIDVALCTNILNAGINIKNDDVELVFFSNSHNINIDHVKQFIGRTRNENTKITIITKNTNENNRINNIITLEELFKKNLKLLFKKRDIVQKMLNSLLDIALEDGVQFDLKYLETFFKKMKYQESKDEFNECLNYNESGVIEINKTLFLEKIINKHDSQIFFLNSENKILNTLSFFLDSDIKMIDLQNEEHSKEINNIIKENKENEKQKNKELKNLICESFKKYNDEEKSNFLELLTLNILKEDKEVISTFENSINPEITDLVFYIKENKKIYEKIKKIYYQNNEFIPNCLGIFFINDFKDKVLTGMRYSIFNKKFTNLDFISKSDAVLLGQDYITIRRLVDEYIQNTLSFRRLTYIYNALQPTNKQVSSFKHIKPCNFDKFLNKIGSVYNIKLYDNKFKITSLKKE